jgi:hypothetical protein
MTLLRRGPTEQSILQTNRWRALALQCDTFGRVSRVLVAPNLRLNL